MGLRFDLLAFCGAGPQQCWAGPKFLSRWTHLDRTPHFWHEGVGPHCWVWDGAPLAFELLCGTGPIIIAFNAMRCCATNCSFHRIYFFLAFNTMERGLTFVRWLVWDSIKFLAFCSARARPIAFNILVRYCLFFHSDHSYFVAWFFPSKSFHVISTAYLHFGKFPALCFISIIFSAVTAIHCVSPFAPHHVTSTASIFDSASPITRPRFWQQNVQPFRRKAGRGVQDIESLLLTRMK